MLLCVIYADTVVSGTWSFASRAFSIIPLPCAGRQHQPSANDTRSPYISANDDKVVTPKIILCFWFPSVSIPKNLTP